MRGKIASSKGTLVTGRFVTRQVNTIARVEIEGPNGTIEILEGTPIHPIWSVDRGDWIPLGELTEGETLHSAIGHAHVRSLTLLNVAIPVYNIEVHGEHVYEVGELGILVHNAAECAWKSFEKWRAKKYGDDISVRNGGLTKGVDLILKNGDWVEQKAWRPSVWNKMASSRRNEKMLEGLENQVNKFILKYPNGKLIVEFAWKMPVEVAKKMGDLKAIHGNKLEFFDGFWKNGG